MTKPKVLITGASGLIGRLTIAGLSDKYEFSGLNRRPVEGIPCLQADINDAAVIKPAFQGMEMVLHLSAYTEDIQDWAGTMATTVMGTLNVFQAAQEAGVKRVVFMSTGSTMCGWEWDDGLPYGKLAHGEYDKVNAPWPLLDQNDPPRPDSPYGVGKLFGEQCGRWFSDHYGMSVLCIRLGAVLDTDRPKLLRHFPGYLSQADAVQMIDKCLSAPMTLKYDIFDAISENRYRWRDTRHAKSVLGWAPTGSSDNFNPDDYR
ncbi:MAG: NAD(P)-dependent oxidoreductase [Caldilineaceae bacterium]